MRAYVLLASFTLLACGSAAGPAADAAGGAAGAAGGAGAAGSAGTGGGGGTAGGSGAAGTLGVGGAGGSSASGQCANIGESEVFGHSKDTLYKINPDTKAVTKVADFSGCDGSVIDIALDKTGAMFGTTFTSVAKIDKSNAKCTTIATGSYPNSLSFVPAGTLLPNDEALVGYEGAAYVRIDLANGKKTTISAAALKGGLVSSGDIVSVIGGGTYLTVKGGNCDAIDCLIRVDPRTGEQLELIGPVGYGDVFGLAYWNGIVFGATKAGELFTFDLTAKKASSVAIANKPASLSFYGAGSTTCAPIGDVK